MDPKALASLDPKLRETYEKVMGTSTSSSTQASVSTAPKPPIASPTATPPAPSVPAPVSTPLSNVPPPANPLVGPNNSAFPTPQINNATVVTAQTPGQGGLVDLQPTPTGAPLPASSSINGTLTKTIQPLPSPASINKAAASSGHSSPIIRSLYVFASIIFLAVYTIFWLKIFKIQIPFLPF